MKPIHVSTKGSCHSASRYSKAAFALSHARSALDGFSQGSHIFEPARLRAGHVLRCVQPAGGLKAPAGFTTRAKAG